MFSRDAGVFAVGFAAGALCLGVLLWAVGGLRQWPQQATAAARPELQAPVPNPADFSAPAQSGPAVVPPPVDSIIPGGEADRAVMPPRAGIPAPGRLAVPVAGVKVNELHDTFQEKRDGHKHEALDIPAARGTPVLAADEGNVVKLFTSKEGGLTVYQFDNSGTWCYYYAHLDHYAPSLREGSLLRKGDTIGYVGTTGDAPPDAPHLHFAIFRLGPEKHWWQGTAIDPLPLLKGQ
jgi:murein DD-endopeptidase MepM/ murein hydrolase activator NlpD